MPIHECAMLFLFMRFEISKNFNSHDRPKCSELRDLVFPSAFELIPNTESTDTGLRMISQRVMSLLTYYISKFIFA